MTKRQNVFNITEGRCYYCGCKIDLNNFHMDHFIAKSNGGKVKKNLVPACVDCNLSKGNLTIEEFREKLIEMATNTHIGRMMSKYHCKSIDPIVFYFEKLSIEENEKHNGVE